MSKIETILTRAMNEPKFADKLFTDAENVLQEYDLSVDEMEKFRNMSPVDLSAITSLAPEERKSFFVIIGNNTEEMHKGG